MGFEPITEGEFPLLISRGVKKPRLALNSGNLGAVITGLLLFLPE
jgi:hypothetical protein